MPASRRLFDHLGAVLNGGDGCVSANVPFDPTLEQFVEAMALQRLRIGKTDWQGRRVNTMIWHFPDLKPSIQAAVSAYVSAQWRNHQQGMSTENPDTIRLEDKIGRPSSAHRAVENPLRCLPETMTTTAATAQPRYDRPMHPIRRADWFDRLTDWIASIVGLWK